MEPIPNARRHLARAIEVGSSEGVALIKKKMCVGDVEYRDQHRPLRPERLARLQIEHRMRWLVLGAITFQEP